MTIETESSGQTTGNQAVRQVSGPSRRPSGTSLGAAGQMSFLKISWSAPRAKKSGGATDLAKVRGWAAPCRGLGPGSQRLGARAPRGLGPGPQSGWGLDPKTQSHNQFFVILKSLLVGGWRRELKRLPQMRGPGGKRTRDIPYPPPRVSRL